MENAWTSEDSTTFLGAGSEARAALEAGMKQTKKRTYQ